MYIIRTRQKNWIEHILRGSSLQREINGRKDGREERKRKAHGLDDGGRILETQGKGTTSRRMESCTWDIWTCREADHLKKKKT